MVFQSFSLFGHMTVIENIMFSPVTLKGVSRQEAYDRGMALDTREEQVWFFRPYAEAVRWIYWCGYPFAMTLEKLDHVAENNRRDLTRAQENVELCRRKHVEKETLLFYSCAVRDYAPLKEQIANAEDPDAFREEHWMEFRILEEAEDRDE